MITINHVTRSFSFSAVIYLIHNSSQTKRESIIQRKKKKHRKWQTHDSKKQQKQRDRHMVDQVEADLLTGGAFGFTGEVVTSGGAANSALISWLVLCWAMVDLVAPLVDDWAWRLLVLGGVKSNGLVKISAANISDGMAWEGVRLWRRDMAWFSTCLFCG